MPKRAMRLCWMAVAAILVTSGGFGRAAAAQAIPPALEGWRDWAIEGQEFRRCPFVAGGEYGDAGQHPCSWPGELELVAGELGGRFSIRWQAWTETWVPLPGDREHPPLAVRLDGAAAPVVEREGVPSLRVGAGSHLVEGAFAWAGRPEALAVPEWIARIALSLDGRSIFPLQRDGSSLWLGQAEEGAGQADSLTIEVYRKLSDDLPPRLETRIGLDVSGRGREEVLGTVLPAGWLPTGLDSPLPAQLGADGRLRAQLRPGNWQIVVTGRGVESLKRVARPTAEAPWPAEEIWSFEPRAELRVSGAAGGRPVDPSQVDVPEEWRPLAAFVVDPGAGLEIEERSRGMAGNDANRLRLERELWLDFAGPGVAARDRIGGRMVQGFRLDLAPPFALLRATAGGEPLLVTAGAEPGLTGVELRSPTVGLEASSRIEGTGRLGGVPVAGWRAPFESVAVNVHLPPGRQLVAALGADSSPDAWVDRWSLFDLFMLLVTCLLAWRLLGVAGGVLTLVALGLAYHESRGPLWALLVVLLLALLGRALPAGRLATVVAWARAAALVALAFVVLPFAVDQLRLALYPQLETSLASGSDGGRLAAVGFLAGDVQAAAPASPGEVPEIAQELEQNAPSRSLGVENYEAKAAKRLQRYASSNVFQAGGGEPGWSWRIARLSWSGPVLPDQLLYLWITPPWLTRGLRVVLVALLGLVLARLARSLRSVPPPSASAAAAAGTALAAGWLLLALVAMPAAAQQTPDPALLDQLRTRLLAPPGCLPDCGALEEARVTLRGETLELALTVHAAALAAVPMPASPEVWRIDTVAIDGAEGGLLRRGGEVFVPLSRGVHRVELRGRLAASDSVDLRFPLAPRRLLVDSPGWESSGRREYQLLTDTLTLVRVRDQGEHGVGAGAVARIPPFVEVVRDLDLDLDWSVTTRVRRVAPRDGSLTVEVPLLPGESVLTPGFEAREGAVTAAFGSGVGELSWESRLERVDRLVLTAGDLAQRSETWRVAVSPQWHAELAGVPAVVPAGSEAYWVHEVHPLPGEALTLTVSRPQAVAGATLAIDGASLDSTPGRRAGEHTLTLALRSTRGGQHVLTLPRDAEVLEVRIDDVVLNLRPEEGRLTLPVHPGAQRVALRFREARGVSMWYRLPAVDLGAPASNLQLALHPPAGRWLLATSGPKVGPAVLFWSELLVMVLAAWVLARQSISPLRFHQWLLLGLGFATASWLALTVVVVWILAIEARRRFSADDVSWWRFDLVQLLCVGLTVAALGCLVYAVPVGLLGSPDMRVAGNSSTPSELRWFADRTASVLPAAGALTLPLFVFRLAMLGWALWLAMAVVGWLRRAYLAFTAGATWRWAPRAPAVVETPAMPGEAGPPPGGAG